MFVLAITIAVIFWTTPRCLDDTARCCEATPLLSSGILCCGVGAMNAVLVREQGTLAKGQEVFEPGADAWSQTERTIKS